MREVYFQDAWRSLKIILFALWNDNESSQKHCRNSSMWFAVDQAAQHFLEDRKQNVLEYKIELEEKGTSKTMPSRYWNTRWILMISAA